MLKKLLVNIKLVWQGVLSCVSQCLIEQEPDEPLEELRELIPLGKNKITVDVSLDEPYFTEDNDFYK